MSYSIISKENNAFVWFPIKTASSMSSWILGHFDFSLYYYVEEISEFMEVGTDLSHFGHSTFLHPGHQKMDFICTMRHPYQRVFSLYKSSTFQFSNNFNRENFERFVDRIVLSNNSFRDRQQFEERFPDYVIKAENFHEDILKIPFIRNSKLYECGILDDMCKKRINRSFDTDKEKEFFTPEIKEKIYEWFKPHFELFGYEK